MASYAAQANRDSSGGRFRGFANAYVFPTVAAEKDSANVGGLEAGCSKQQENTAHDQPIPETGGVHILFCVQ